MLGCTFPLSVSLCWLDTWRKRYQNISQLRSQCKFHRTPWRDGSRCVATSNKMKEVSSAASSPPARRCGRVLNVTNVTKGGILTWIQMVSSTRINTVACLETWLPTNSRLLYCMFFNLNPPAAKWRKRKSIFTFNSKTLPVERSIPRATFHLSRFWMLSRGHRRRRRPCNPSLRRQLGAGFQENWWRKPWEKIRPSSEMRWKQKRMWYDVACGVIWYDMMWYDMALWFSS